MAIVLTVFLRFTNSDYPFGIFQLFLYGQNTTDCNRGSCFINGTRKVWRYQMGNMKL